MTTATSEKGVETLLFGRTIGSSAPSAIFERRESVTTGDTIAMDPQSLASPNGPKEREFHLRMAMRSDPVFGGASSDGHFP